MMKVDQIRPDALMQGQKVAMQKDIELLSSWSANFVEFPCPACSSSKREPVYKKYGMQHWLCGDCGTQFISPRPTSELLAEFYARSANYEYWARHIYPVSAETRREQIFKPRADLVERVCLERGMMGTGTFVEVGAGYGIFCAELMSRKLFDHVVGLEPSPELAEICREKGIEIIEAPYEKARFSQEADVLASFEVIEHLFSPETFAHWLFDSIKPGGLLILTCPNIRGFDTLLLGRESTVVDHQHLNYFHPDSISLLLERTGFRDIQVTTPGKLDLDLVRRAHRSGAVDAQTLGPFIGAIVEWEDEETDTLLQRFLQDARLSSNMMAVASRP